MNPAAVALFSAPLPVAAAFVWFVEQVPGRGVWNWLFALGECKAERVETVRADPPNHPAEAGGAAGRLSPGSGGPRLPGLGAIQMWNAVACWPAWAAQLDACPANGQAALGLVAPCPLLHALRLRKSADELERMPWPKDLNAEGPMKTETGQLARPGSMSAGAGGGRATLQEAGRGGPAYGSNRGKRMTMLVLCM